ncbi:MAG: DUF4150 domain-containing protein [Rhodospirillales bacterium]|nr:DUF4150 domain-containing protein [Rhodospirillales bacterium]
MPDFCKTPAPPAPPIPVPYINVAQSSDTADGSTTVKMDGNPIMLKTSKFSTSMGDEPGTLKGVVSNTNMGIAKFVNYSFDVKVEGKNVPRLGDPMTNNGNAANTTTVAELQATTGVSNIDMTDEQVKAICEAFCDTQEEYDKGELPPGSGNCSRRLEEKLQQLGDPNILSEQAAIVGATGGQIVTPNYLAGVYQAAANVPTSGLAGPLTKILSWCSGMPGNAAVPNWMANQYISEVNNNVANAWPRRPDIVTTNPVTGGGEVLDAKFTWKSGEDSLSPGQSRDYPKLNNGKDPIVIDNMSCGCSASI